MSQFFERVLANLPPSNWRKLPVRSFVRERKEFSDSGQEDLLSVSEYTGVTKRSENVAEGDFVSRADSLIGYRKVNVDDLVMNYMLAWKGACAVSSLGGITSPAYAVFDLDQSKVSPAFIHSLFRSEPFRAYFRTESTGVIDSRLRLYPEKLKGLPVSLPAIQDQRKISGKIDRETARFDALIEKKTRFIELLKEKRQALIHEALAHPETMRMRLSHCTATLRRPIIRRDDETYTALGLFNRGRGVFHKPATQGEDLGDSNFFWVRANDLILSGQFSWEGAVALATDEHDGCVVSHRYHVYRGMPNLLDTSYLWAYFTSHEGDFVLNEHSRGSAGRNRPLNSNSLAKEKIPIPPMHLQAEIAKLVSFERRLKKLVDKSKSLLNEHRSALITAAVTGQIDLQEVA